MVATVIVGTLAGWVAVFAACLVGPRLGRAARRFGAPVEPGAVPRGVIALLAGRTDRDAFTATLLDLARRGWFRIEPPDQPPGPSMCVLASRAPSGPLTPYEQQAVSHLTDRAGPQGLVPADALTDGFIGGEDAFYKAFRRDLLADSRGRGLTRPTFTVRRKALLFLLALVPPGAALLATPFHRSTLPYFGLYFVILCALVQSVGSERLTPAGQEMLAAATAEPAYAAAVGQSPTPFGSPGKDVAWSGYGDKWRQVTIPDANERVWPGISVPALVGIMLLTVPGIPLLGVAGWIFIRGGHGAELGILSGIGLVILVFAKAVARFAHLPLFAEFDGLVLREWQIEGEDTVSYFVAIDDGTSAQAWAFEVPGGQAATLAPGTLVHARINPRLNKQLSVQPLRRLQATPFNET